MSSETTLEPEIAAVIAAAVATVIKRPHRIASVQQAAALVPYIGYVSPWALEGRRHIHTTRRPR